MQYDCNIADKYCQPNLQHNGVKYFLKVKLFGVLVASNVVVLLRMRQNFVKTVIHENSKVRLQKICYPIVFNSTKYLKAETAVPALVNWPNSTCGIIL